MKLVFRNQFVNELITNSTWSLIGIAISKGLLLLVWVVISWLLSVDEYGEFGMIRTTTIMFSSFAGFSLGVTATKFISQYKKTNIEVCGRILGLTLLFSLISGLIICSSLFLFSDYIATETLHAPLLSNLVKMSSVIILVNSINGAQIGALYGLEKYKSVALINILQIIVSFPFFVLLTYYFGVVGSVIALIVHNSVICVFSHNALVKSCREERIKIDYRNARKEIHVIYRYSFPAVLSGMLVLPVRWGVEAMLFSQKEGSFLMGMFTAAATFQLIIISSSGLLNAPFLSLMSKNQEQSRTGIISVLNIYTPWLLGVFFALPIIILPELGVLFFGSNYNTDVFRNLILCVGLSTVFMMFRQGLSRLIDVYSLQWWGALDNFIWALILFGSFWMLKSYGAIGLAISYLIAYSFNCLIVIPFYIYKKVLDKNIIYSKHTMFLWMFICLVSFSCIFISSLYIRIFLLLFSFFVLFLVLRDMFYSKYKNNDT